MLEQVRWVSRIDIYNDDDGDGCIDGRRQVRRGIGKYMQVVKS